jgi:hypothetical protein
MFHVDEFWFRPHLEDTNAESEEVAFDESILVWIQSEEKDESDRTAVLRKMVKNIRWLSQKADCNTIILHSFAHLGESKADSDFADSLIEETAMRLRNRDYEVHIVPLGLNEFKMHVRGPSLAKVFKAF